MAPYGYQIVVLIYYHSAKYLSATKVLYDAIQGKQGIYSEGEQYLWILTTGRSFHVAIPAATKWMVFT